MKESICDKGFTLLQVSILLLVSSMVLVNLLPTAQTKLTNDKNANNTLNAIFLALREYQASHGRLPCPADASLAIGAAHYGFEAANPGAATDCTGGAIAANNIDAAHDVALGMVPVKTLGIANDYAIDAYGRGITYAVDTNATELGWASTTLTSKITVTDNGSPATTVAALVSHGMDGHGAWVPLTGASGTAVKLNAGSSDADQLTNAHVDGSFTPIATLTNFVKKQITATFDDFIVYKSGAWNINTIPMSVPRISSITPPSDGCYNTGQDISFALTYNKAVVVTGTPRLTLTVGAHTRYATYVSGSGTTTLVFTYVVVGADSAPNGISIAPALDNNGGTVMTGLAYAVRGFTAPTLTGVTVNNCCGGKIYVADLNTGRVEVFGPTGDYQSQFGNAWFGVNGIGHMTFDPAGTTLYISNDNPFGSYVMKVDGGGNYISEIGTPGGGSGDGQFEGPGGIAFAANGNILMTDEYTSRVEVFDKDGNYLSQFGNGAVNMPVAVAFDDNGNIYEDAYVSSGVLKYDSGYNPLLWIPVGGRTHDIAFNSAGTLYVSVLDNCKIQKYDSSGTHLGDIGSCGSGDGQFDHPYGIDIDSDDNLYVADGWNQRIQKFDSSGNFVMKFGSFGTGDGQFFYPYDVAVGPDPCSSVYIADLYNFRIRKVDGASGTISTYAGNGVQDYTGDGGAATSAELVGPYGIAADKHGNIYFSDSSGGASIIRKVTKATGVITTVAGGMGRGYSGDGGAATSAHFDFAEDLTVDGYGNIYITDIYNAVVRKVTAATGIITTVAGNGTSGDSGDGGPATAAQFSQPNGVAVDSAGNLYISDYYNNRVRKVAAGTGTLTTYAGNGTVCGAGGNGADGVLATATQLNCPGGLAVDDNDNLYIANYTGGTIRKVTAATGIISTVAGDWTNTYSGDGGLATSAGLHGPGIVRVDHNGDLYITEIGRVRKVTAATGIITTIAGDGTAGYNGDGGPATNAQLNSPSGAVVVR